MNKRFAGIRGARVIVLNRDAARAGVTPAAEQPSREATPADLVKGERGRGWGRAVAESGPTVTAVNASL
jgi:hypothetical protein